MLKSIVKKKLNKLDKRNPTNREITSFHDAETIGILYDYNLESSDQQIVNKWVKWLSEKGKKVQLCNIQKSKLKKGNAVVTSPLELHSNHFNIFGKPKLEEAIVFMHSTFDYLVTFQTNPGKEVRWLSAGSRAKLRIGPYKNDDKLSYCDLYIKSDEESINTYIDKLENTVDNINK